MIIWLSRFREVERCESAVECIEKESRLSGVWRRGGNMTGMRQGEDEIGPPKVDITLASFLK